MDPNKTHKQWRFPRISREVSAEISNLSGNVSGAETYRGDTEVGYSRNISGTGICLTVSQPYEPETPVSLKLGIPTQSSRDPLVFTAFGKVIWSRKLADNKGYDMGIEFSPRSFGEAKRLYSVLNRILSSEESRNFENL